MTTASDYTFPPTEEDWYEEEEEPYEYEEEEYGYCDVCGQEYYMSGSDHCGTEGLCWKHCTDRIGHDPLYRHIIEEAIAEVTDGT